LQNLIINDIRKYDDFELLMPIRLAPNNCQCIVASYSETAMRKQSLLWACYETKYTVSQKTSPFLFLWYLCQTSSDSANFWHKRAPGNL